MKTMKIEKIIELHQQIETIENLKCTCHLDYVAEENGIRAAGIILVEATGIFNSSKQAIKEEIEVNILAPHIKIDDETAFRVSLKDWQGNLENNKLNLNLDFVIDGLIEENDLESEENDVIEDLIHGDSSIRSVQRYIIAQKGDTYQSIAKRYYLSEKDLIELNQHKPIEYKCLVLLPE